MVDIACLGHILNEKIIFPDRMIYPVLGSPVAYSSVCLASMGVDVGIVTKIGKDFPEELLKVFKETDVDIDGINVGDLSTNNELIYDKDGNKTLRFITRAPEIFIDDIPDEYWQARIFCINPIDYEVSLDTIKKLSGKVNTMAADLGGYGGGTSAKHPQIKDGHDIKMIAPYLDIAKASIEDLRYVFGEDATENEVSQKIIEWGVKTVIVTLGGKGSYVKEGNKEKYIQAFPVKEFVDQTGAGDCFFAGFLSDYIINKNPFRAVLYGNASSSYIVERTGGVIAKRMPDMKEVNNRVKELSKIII